MNEYFVKRECCPCCESSNSTTICNASNTKPPLKDYYDSFYNGRVEYKYLRGTLYILLECENCGLIYQKHVPNGFLMSRLYDVWIDPQMSFKKYKNRNVRYFNRLAEEIISVIQYFSAIPSQLKILDFGMGWGSWCRMAQAFGSNVYGIELSPIRIDYATASGLKVLSWEEISEHQFDFINTEQVFEHLLEPLETLTRLKSVLKPSGVIKISVPNGWDIKRKLSIWDWTAPKGSQNSLNPVAPLEHINCFNQNAILTMAEKVGLKRIFVHIPDSQSPKTKLRAVIKSFRKKQRSKTSTYLFFSESAATVK